MSAEDWLAVRRSVAAGQTLEGAARAAGVSERTLQRLRPGAGSMMQRAHVRSALRLSVQEREEISRGLRAGDSLRAIARRLGRAASTLSREVARTGGRKRYRAWRGERGATHRARRPKHTKLQEYPRLRQEVERRLEECWSPQQVAASLKRDFPHCPELHVSHETLYRSLYVQTRGALRKELTACLRTGRTQRRPQGRTDLRGQLPDKLMLSARPPEVEDRAVPGHWEGDLILGKQGKSAVGTLVERHSRYVMLLHLPEGRTAGHVRQALTHKIGQLPDALRRSLTWDQGKEMSEHVRFTLDTAVQVYFCDPHSPWQRGSNENTNGLLRQYMPKGMDLSHLCAQQLDAIAAQLNSRPRQTLDWHTPPRYSPEPLR
ncbi:IS30 family transposase [Pyxidicoccus sp. MSG2]|uniref:IS30 family transposase n=1 Tax=Pyxidicoccus sp. MSG2 TaxID=2996790 RepID=UPI002271D893|nr:IS30 family transposase [Pyxidicoccus sp. MSG2]MCY1016499.1 IS30 family transposase [Pyxidicoccus sp. MSG2]